MLALAEERYGPRDHYRSVRPVGFHNGVPQVFYPSPDEIEIRLGLNCETNHVRGCYQLAHEVIHMLSPVDHYNATTLEEGIATSFAHSYIREHLRQTYAHSGDWRYDAARALLECFLAGRPGAILRLRQTQTVISRINAPQILSLYPEVPPFVAQHLTGKFHIRPIA
jgi:hypothetical protein